MEQRMDSGYRPGASQYEQQALYGIDSVKMDGQKIEKPLAKEKSAYVPRLILAMSSLIAMMIVSLVVVNLAYTRMQQWYYYNGEQPPVYVYSDSDGYFFLLLGVVMVLFFVATLVINMMFNRKQG